MPQEKLRGALFGCGHVSLFHLRAWAEIEEVRIVALGNRTRSKAESRASEFNIPLDHVYSNYEELLEKEDIDFVDIATAPDIHRQQVEAAAAHGVHILCQKPFAPTLEDAQAMIAACDQAGVLFTINENWRWREWYREIKKLFNEGLIGRIRYVGMTFRSDATILRPDGSLPPLFVNQPYTKEMGKLILYEWGIHLIDVLRFLIGEIDCIYMKMDHVSSLCKGEDRALVVLDMGGVTGLIDISWATVGEELSPFESFVAEGDEGNIELLVDQGYKLRVAKRDSRYQRPAFVGSIEEAYQRSYTAAQRHFVECLIGGQVPETVAQDNLRTLIATLAAYESAAKNQVISI